MIAPWSLPGFELLPMTFVFGLMLLGNVYVVLRLFPKAPRGATLADVTILIGILLMALGLWGALIYAILSPGDASEVSVFIALNSMMAVVGCWAIALFLRAERRALDGGGWRWPAVFGGLLVLNEWLMGVAFVLIEQAPATFGSGALGAGFLGGAAAISPWFFWAMGANMLLLAYRIRLPASTRRVLAGFALSSFMGPWLATDPLAAGIAMGVVMGVVLAISAREWRSRSLRTAELRALAVVWGGFALMAASEWAYLMIASTPLRTFTLGIGVLLAMSAEVLYLLHWGLGESARSERAAGDVLSSESVGTPATET